MTPSPATPPSPETGLREKLLIAVHDALVSEGIPETVFKTRNPSGAVADAVLAILPTTQAIRERALEEAAKVSDRMVGYPSSDIAKAIRALSRSPAAEIPAEDRERRDALYCQGDD